MALAAMLLGSAAPAWGDERQSATALPPNAATVRTLMGRVVGHADDTPGGEGYLQVARQQVDEARRHLRLALDNSQDVSLVKYHVSMALHALDPALGSSEGGPSYGLRPALTRAAEAMGEVARSGMADSRAAEAAAALSSSLDRVNEAADFGRAALVTPSAQVVRQAARGMLMALDRSVDGWNRTGNGHIDWQQGEAGLTEAETAANGLAAAVAMH